MLGAALDQARRAVTTAAASIDRNVIEWTQGRMRRAAAAERAARARRGEVARAEDDDARARARVLEIVEAYRGGAGPLPSPFFAAPERATLQLTRLGDGPHGTTVYDVTHPSAYQPYWPGIRESYLAYRENGHSHARWWRGPRGPGETARPVMIVVHGWRAGAHWVSERVFEVAYWLRHGFDVISFQLPLHGARTPEGAASGALFLTRNLARTNEAFGHAIYDLRALAAALRAEHGVTQLGALGMSLGGYTTALWSTVTAPMATAATVGAMAQATGAMAQAITAMAPASSAMAPATAAMAPATAAMASAIALAPAPAELDFAIAMIPAVEMHKLMMRSSGRRERAAGIDESLLEEAFAVHAPLGRPPQLPPERLFVIGGDGDRITPPEHARALIAHWRCQSHWFAGGHLAQVGRPQAMRAARLQLAAAGVGRGGRGGSGGGSGAGGLG